MIGKEKFRKIKREIKELQAKTHGIYCMVQHLNRVLCDMGMDSQSQNSRDLDKIKRIATIFRNAILRIKDISPLICLRDFPKGACGDAALLLGYHLNKLGYDPLLYTTGYKGDCSHAWIQMEDLIIDITADQEKVIITSDDKWHRKFIVDLQRQPDINAYDGYSREILLSAYNQIVSNTMKQAEFFNFRQGFKAPDIKRIVNHDRWIVINSRRYKTPRRSRVWIDVRFRNRHLSGNTIATNIFNKFCWFADIDKALFDPYMTRAAGVAG